MGQSPRAHRRRGVAARSVADSPIRLVAAFVTFMLVLGAILPPETLAFAPNAGPINLLASGPESGPRNLDRKGLSVAETAAGDSGETSEPGGLWGKLRQNPVIAKVAGLIEWVLAGLKLLWAIPKAIIQGDSRALIEAIGELLSRAAPDTSSQQEAPATVPAPSPADGPASRPGGTPGATPGRGPGRGSGNGPDDGPDGAPTRGLGSR